MKTRTHQRYGDAQQDDGIQRAGRTIGKRSRSHARYATAGKAGAARARQARHHAPIGPLMSPSDYLTQAPPGQRNGVEGISDEVAFSGVLAKYARGGSVDIYDGNYPKTVGGKVKKDFESAYNQVYWIACKNTVDEMLRRKGVAETGAAETINTMTGSEPTDDAGAGKSRLDRLLEQGMPVMVGLDYYVGNMNANATDHYVVVVQRGKDDRGVFYSYFDPGRTSTAGHNLENNRIYVGFGKDNAANENMISGDNGLHDYSLSEVRDMEAID